MNYFYFNKYLKKKNMNKIYVLSNDLAFEIDEKDLPQKLTWTEALNESLKIGNRWRLPNKEELEEMYKLHRKGIGNFQFDKYWSSDGKSDYTAFSKCFKSGDNYSQTNTRPPAPKNLVRLIRSI